MADEPGSPIGMTQSQRDNARLSAFISDLESIVAEDEDGSEWVSLEDAKKILRQYAEHEPSNEHGSGGGAVTWVWPHDGSRKAPTDVRLRMPMDLPVFAELRRPGSRSGEGVAADPTGKGYVFTLEPFAWGRFVHVKLVGEDMTVYVADAQRTRKVYAGKRGDAGDIHRKASGR
jgi:hypothetical protein